MSSSALLINSPGSARRLRPLAARLFALLTVVLAALTLTTLSACAGGNKAQKAATEQVVGTWSDEGDVLYTFVADGANLRLTRVLDTDGEEFEVLSCEWEDDTYKFTYKVHSTGYVVTTWITQFGDDSMSTRWSNLTPEGGSNSGEETFVRVE